MRQHAFNQYRSQQVTTASPAELIGMLYDALLAQARAARQAIDERRAADVHGPLVKAQDIVTELRCALRFDGEGAELARNLDGVYGYTNALLVQANVGRDVRPLDDVVRIIEPLRDAWRAACIEGAQMVAAG